MSDVPTTPSKRAAFTAWIRTHKTLATLLGVGAVAVIAVAAIGIPAAVNTIDHANADTAYQAARVKATAQYRQDVKAQKEFATALAASTELKTQLAQIHD